MHFHAPQIIFMVLVSSRCFFSFFRRGKPKTGTHSFVSDLGYEASLIAFLYWGGFFD